MAFYIDEAAGRIVEVLAGAEPDRAWVVIDSDTASLCDVWSGQFVSRDQIAALKEGAIARYRSLSVEPSVGAPAAPQSVAAAAPRTSAPPAVINQTSLPARSGWFIAASILAVLGWIGAAATTMAKYGEAQGIIDARGTSRRSRCSN